MNRNEMLRLVLTTKAEERQLHGKLSCNGYVIDSQELGRFLNQLFRNPPIDQQRLQLMVQKDNHYTAIDIELSPEGNRCFVMDAALHHNYMDIVELLNRYDFDDVFVTGSNTTIQKDNINCSAYSLSHIFNTSKKPELFEYLNTIDCKKDEETQIKFIEWEQLSSDFLDKAQSITLLAKHPQWKENFKNEMSLETYILEKGVEEREQRGEMRKVNILIEKKFASYASKSNELLQKIDVEAAMNISSMNSLTKLHLQQIQWQAEAEKSNNEKS